MFMSFAAIYSLIDLAQRQAQDVRDQSLAIQVAQSKLNELRAGSLAMSGQGGDCGDTLPGWEWSITADQFEVQGLWRVRVEVKQNGKPNADNGAYLEQIVLDPSVRGSALDQATVTSSSSSSSTDSSSSSSSGSSGSSGASSGSSSKPQTPSGGSSKPSGGGAMPSGGGSGSKPSGGMPSGGGSGSKPSGGSGGKPSGGSGGRGS